MTQTDVQASLDKSIQTENTNEVQATQQINAPIETINQVTDKGEGVTQDGSDVVELNKQLQETQDKMDRQTKVNAWLMDVIKEKGMLEVLGLK